MLRIFHKLYLFVVETKTNTNIYSTQNIAMQTNKIKLLVSNYKSQQPNSAKIFSKLFFFLLFYFFLSSTKIDLVYFFGFQLKWTERATAFQ